MKQCENCNNNHNGDYGSGRFCSSKCARGFSTKDKRSLINEKVSKKLSFVPVLIKNCAQCNIVFDTKNVKQLYCSKSCGASATSKGWTNHSKIDWSSIHREAYKNGNNYVAGGTCKWIEITTSNGLIKVQGSYEVRVVKILEQWKIKGKIINWQYSPTRFKYYDENHIERTYLIDFLVIENNKMWYLEVKGYTQAKDLLKWKAVNDLKHHLVVWHLDQIKENEKHTLEV